MTAAVVSPPSMYWGEFMAESARIEVRGGDDWVTRNKMDRFIATIELIAAFFIGLVAIDIFVTVVLRNFFAMALPDSYDIGQLLLGILIFWGIAATSYRGTHITVDVVWANASPRYQRWIDVFATLVLLFVVAMQTYSLVDKVASNYNANLQTFELRLPTWPFLAVAWAGDAAAVVLIAIRTYRLIFQPEAMARGQQDIKAVD
jgi:TRAP-type transport system small permease protein